MLLNVHFCFCVRLCQVFVVWDAQQRVISKGRDRSLPSEVGLQWLSSGVPRSAASSVFMFSCDTPRVLATFLIVVSRSQVASVHTLAFKTSNDAKTTLKITETNVIPSTDIVFPCHCLDTDIMWLSWSLLLRLLWFHIPDFNVELVMHLTGFDRFRPWLGINSLTHGATTALGRGDVHGATGVIIVFFGWTRFWHVAVQW